MEKLLCKTVELLKKYGKVNTYHSLLIVIILSLFGVFLKNQEVIIETYLKSVEQRHLAGLEYRQQINPQISNIISKLLIEIDASHVGLSELHNGELNAAIGLPFLKFTMLYEEFNHNSNSVMRNYEKVNTSSYKSLNNIFKGGIKRYNVNNYLRDIDSRLYFDLVGAGVKRIYICPIYGVNKDLAFITVSYKEDIPLSDEEIFTKIFVASQKISALYNGYKK